MEANAQRTGNEFSEIDRTRRDLPSLKLYELVYRRDGRQGDEVTLHFWGRDASVALFQAESHVPAEYPIQIMEEGRELAVVARSAGGYWRVERHAGADRRAVAGARAESPNRPLFDAAANGQSLFCWENEGGAQAGEIMALQIQ